MTAADRAARSDAGDGPAEEREKEWEPRWLGPLLRAASAAGRYEAGWDIALNDALCEVPMDILDRHHAMRRDDD